jgi:hypothetical protein
MAISDALHLSRYFSSTGILRRRFLGDDGLTNRERRQHAKRYTATGGRKPSEAEMRELEAWLSADK